MAATKPKPATECDRRLHLRQAGRHVVGRLGIPVDLVVAGAGGAGVVVGPTLGGDGARHLVATEPAAHVDFGLGDVGGSGIVDESVRRLGEAAVPFHPGEHDAFEHEVVALETRLHLDEDASRRRRAA